MYRPRNKHKPDVPDHGDRSCLTPPTYTMPFEPHAVRVKDGTLHEVKPVDLGAGLLRALRARHDLDTSYVDDVVMGCVTPVGEQGQTSPR